MDKDKLTLYRKRLIPEECVLLKDDIIIDCTEDMIITKWNAFRPKSYLHHGFSCYLLHKGVKISKFLLEDDTLKCWYCDIVSYEYRKQTNTLICTDLLADVIIYPDGKINVVDLDELSQALEKHLCNDSQVILALNHLNWLLQFIYQGKFEEITSVIDSFSTEESI